MNIRLFVIVILALFIQDSIAQPSTYRMGDVIRITQGDTLSNNTILAGQSIEVSGYLDNDLFSASRIFLLNGNITDDAFVAGQMVSVYGHIGDMLVSAGETVVIDGTIEGDLFAVGREVRIGQQARIQGNAFLAGGSIVFDRGTIEGTLRIAGEHIELNGTIRNSATIYSDDVTFGEEYEASYGTTITSSEPLYRENLGVIPPNLTMQTKETNIWAVILFQAWFFLSLLVTGLILIRLFQKTAIDMSKFATETFWKNTGWGLLAFIAVPIAIVILGLLLITLPLSLLLGLTYAFALFISYLLVAMSLGVISIIYFTGEAKTSTYYWGLVLGMVYIAILTNLPFIGGILNVVLLLFGLGSLAHYIWRISESNRSSDIGIPTSTGGEHTP